MSSLLDPLQEVSSSLNLCCHRELQKRNLVFDLKHESVSHSVSLFLSLPVKPIARQRVSSILAQLLKGDWLNKGPLCVYVLAHFCELEDTAHSL